MSDDTRSSGDGSTPQMADGSEADLVAFADCELVSINKACMLVINRQNGMQQMMSPQVVEGLKTCTTFKPVKEHAAYLAKRRPELQGQEAMAAQAMNNLKGAGLLLRANTVCQELSRSRMRSLPATRVFIITCDRPAAVERLLDSILQNGKPSQHDALLLMDDSRDPNNREANRQAVAKFNLRSPREMCYLGAEAQASFLADMIQQLPQYEEGIRFLLDHDHWIGAKTYGRSRTLCLLFSLGYRALVMDDDILCQAVLPPLTEEGVGIGTSARQAMFYASQQEMLQHSRTANFDPLTGHATYLGANLGTALQELNAGPMRQEQLRGCNAALANVLLSDSPILVTQSGSLGDPGTGSAHWVLAQREASMQRLAEASHGVRAAAENRLNWVGSPQAFFHKMSVMSQLTGLDNSFLLPPYFPAYRGEDALFGAMLVAIHPKSVSLEYPFAVPHLPLESRHYSVDDPIALRGDASIFARYLTEKIDFNDSTTPEHNMGYLAQDLQRVASRSDGDLLLDFRREHARFQASYLNALQDQAERTAKFGSAELQAYLGRGIQELQQVLGEVNSPSNLPGVTGGSTDAELIARFRALALGFSGALQGWVEARDVAGPLADGMIDCGQLLPK
ncbi:MAG: hypothetical protein HRT77_11445 [Halioglobus sp.]|nr:hypothetical protein [Halioglobus sp.]